MVNSANPVSKYVTVKQVQLTEMLSPEWMSSSIAFAWILMVKLSSLSYLRCLTSPISSTMPVKRDVIGVELKWGLKGSEDLVEKSMEREGDLNVKLGFLSWDFSWDL